MWHKRSTRRRCEPEQVRTARQIAEEAKRVRRRVEAQEPKAKKLNSILRDALEGNHFGETLGAALAPRRGGSG